MGDAVWRLDAIGDFIYLLDCYGPDQKNVLQRRFKKDGKALSKLYDILKNWMSLDLKRQWTLAGVPNISYRLPTTGT